MDLTLWIGLFQDFLRRPHEQLRQSAHRFLIDAPKKMVQAIACKWYLSRPLEIAMLVTQKPWEPPMKTMTFLFLLLLTSQAAPLNGRSNTDDAVEAVTKLIHDDVKASLAGDTNFVRTNYVNGYIEGTSLGTWMTKEQFLDTSKNKVSSRNLSDLKVEVFGDTAIARFHQTYDALIEGKQHSRTTICTQTWNKQAAAWKLLASHCSRVQ